MYNRSYYKGHMYNIDMEQTKAYMEKLGTALDCYKAELRLVETTNERLNL